MTTRYPTLTVNCVNQIAPAMILKQQNLQMSSAIVILAAVGLTEGFGLAEMISNYAKVTTNNGFKTTNVTTDRFEPNSTSYAPEGYTVLPDISHNETDYEDFDDLEASTESAISRQTSITPGTVLKYFNGLFSLLALMNNFSGSGPMHKPKRRLANDIHRGGYSAAGQERYLPDTATKKFKYQGDQEQQPIGNYPPYNPLTANEAETYNMKNGKTSYDADLQQFKKSNSMSEYMAQNHDPNLESYSYDTSHAKPDGDWNAITQDYSDYKTGHMWRNPKDKNQWRVPEEHPVYHYSLPEKKPHDYHDLILGEPADDVHHHLIEDEDRETKHPYSYYFLGRKLWYTPLIFSVYFILYIGALVLKSIARHKIQFPEKLWDLKDEHYKHRRYRKVDEITEMYDKAIDSAKNKFM